MVSTRRAQRWLQRPGNCQPRPDNSDTRAHTHTHARMCPRTAPPCGIWKQARSDARAFIVARRHARIVVLDMSNNNFAVLPREVGRLKVLRELDISNNKMEFLPVELATCARLRVLHAGGNGLRSLPAELQQLTLLEELVAPDNAITTLPTGIVKLPRLTVLDLARNDLRRLPPELADSPSLEDIDVSGNERLETVPAPMRMNAELIRWACGRDRERARGEADLRAANEELELLCRAYDTERLALREEAARLRAENRELSAQMPRRYMRLQAACASCCAVM